MLHLHFNMALVQFLEAHRTFLLTKFFLFFSDLGEIDGYILIATLIYVAFDKALAVRLSVLVLLTMCQNHVLKIMIGNPRPFVREGTYMRNWAVPAENARDLAMEYSTPSGHAMASAGFYSYLIAYVRSPAVTVTAVILIILIGLSRPYLGVHYAEDVLLGWVIGLGLAAAAVFYGDRIAVAWTSLGLARQCALLVAASIALWLSTVAFDGWHIGSQPRAFLAYAGSLTGILIARPLELRFVDFDPQSSGVLSKFLRFAVTVTSVIVTLRLLGELFADLANDFSLPGYALQYLRYALAGTINIFLAPLVFTRLGLAEVNSV